MTVNKAIEMIDEYLTEPHSVNREWVECLTLCKDAVEKQMSKKIIKKNPIVVRKDIDGQEYYAYDYHCPMCDTKLKLFEHHCSCGQALDWSDNE